MKLFIVHIQGQTTKNQLPSFFIDISSSIISTIQEALPYIIQQCIISRHVYPADVTKKHFVISPLLVDVLHSMLKFELLAAYKLLDSLFVNKLSSGRVIFNNYSIYCGHFFTVSSYVYSSLKIYNGLKIIQRIWKDIKW